MTDENVVNPYESIAEDAKKQLTRVKALAASLDEKVKSASESEKVAVLAESVTLLWKELSNTSLSMLADVAALTRDLDEGLSGVEEAIDAIAEADSSTDNEDEEDEEGDEDVTDEEYEGEDDGDDTGDSQLEADHAEALKFLVSTLKTMLETAIAQPALDPQQKSELQTIINLCVAQAKFIDDVTLVEDDEEEESDE